MDKAEVLEYIKAQLGHPTIRVHTADTTIEANIDKAFRMFKSKILPEKTVVIPFTGSSQIDISEHKPVVVLHVEPELESSSGYNDYDEFQQQNIQQIFSTNNTSVQDYAYARQRQGNLEYLFGSFDWDFRDGILYVDNVRQGAKTLTVQMMFEATLEDMDHENWIEDYSLALTKIVEGRIRSKFSGGPMEFESDGQTLVEEGKQEKTDLEESLKGRAPLKGIRKG